MMHLPHYSRQQNNRGPSRGGKRHPRRALCPRMAAISERKCPPGAEGDTFVPRRQQFPGGTTQRRALCPRMAAISGRNPSPGGTLSPKGNGFREEPTPGGHFVPEWQQFLGGPPPGALCPQMATVSRRKCPPGAERDTFVPEWRLFPGEMVLS